MAIILEVRIIGTIPEMYEEAMRWLKSCLNRPQNGQSFNSVGELEISEVALEELLQNALVHLDLLKPAAIRLLVFDNRIEIINPGSLPDGQTIDEILLGNSDPRNPQLAQFGSNTMPYRGLGSGIPRVMATGSDVELIDRPEGNQFVARIWRTTRKDETTTQKARSRNEIAICPANTKSVFAGFPNVYRMSEIVFGVRKQKKKHLRFAYK